MAEGDSTQNQKGDARPKAQDEAQQAVPDQKKLDAAAKERERRRRRRKRRSQLRKLQQESLKNIPAKPSSPAAPLPESKEPVKPAQPPQKPQREKRPEKVQQPNRINPQRAIDHPGISTFGRFASRSHGLRLPIRLPDPPLNRWEQNLHRRYNNRF